MGEKGLNALAKEAGYIGADHGQIPSPNDNHVEQQFDQGLEGEEPWAPVAPTPEDIKPDKPDVVDIKGDSTYSQPDAPNSQPQFSGGGLDALGGAIADSIELPPVLPPAFDQSDGNELPP